ncbi:MAG: membrane protein insertase YidC [Chthonomonas sp.]|nr:membrane protein insertase YidC [Chthonomonas sp.]
MKPAAPTKQSFIQTLLIFSVVFLGMQLMCNPGNRGAGVAGLTSQELLAKMRTASTELRANDVQSLSSTYQSQVDAELKAGKIKPADAELARVTGAVIVADTYLRRAQANNNQNDSMQAFNTLTGWERKHKKNAAWSTQFALAPKKDQPQVMGSGATVYEAIKVDLDARYRKDKVWGLVQGYGFIDGLVALTGRVSGFSYAFAAFILAVIVRAIVWPLAQRQLIFGRRMTQLQPLMKELEETFKKKDPSGAFKNTPEYQQKVMGLYKEYGINPLAGCLPALLQMPLFLFVYQCMMHYRFSFENGTFLWVNAGMHDATNGFIARSLGETDSILIVLYGISMIATTLLAPVSDPNNAQQQRRIGLVLAVVWTVMMFFFPLPSAFVLYWIFTNVLSSAQSLIAYRIPLPPLQKLNAPGGGVFPTPTHDGNGVTTNGLFGKTGGPKAQKPKGKKA